MLYHANCADGFGAAWAARTKWADLECLPVSYGGPVPDVAGKHVLIGDFSFKRDVLREMGRSAKSIIILDHHQTAMDDLREWIVDDVDGSFWAGDNPMKAIRENDERIGQPIAALFDMDRSGARMVWDFCHDGDVPLLLQLIEDRDLWRFRFDETKPFALWLRAEPFDFNRWTDIAELLDTAPDAIMAEANAMQRFYDQKVAEIAGLSRPMKIGGFTVPACNCPPMFASDVGHALLDKHTDAPFVACYSDQGDARGFSLRSRDDREDVSAIAKKYGGGGHRNAAGFGVPA